MKVYVVSNLYLQGGIRVFKNREDAEACLQELKEKNWVAREHELCLSNPVRDAKVMERDLE